MHRDHSRSWYCLCVAFVAVLNSDILLPQETGHNETPAVSIALVDLSPPVFPPLARQARIMGDVRVKLDVRKDGSVASAEVVSGHPMLKQSALDSAQKSKFMCNHCNDDVNSCLLTYTFGFRNDGSCLLPRKHSWKCLKLWNCGGGQYGQELRSPVLGQAHDRVVILADTMCVETSRSEN